jgi:hypothetical protein
MARRLYVLNRSPEHDPVLQLRLVFWIDIPLVRRPDFADPTFESAVPDCTAAELTDLRAGAIVERVRTFRWADDVSEREVRAIVIEYGKQLRRELLGLANPRSTFFQTGMSYDPVTDTWTG